ncbi:hypothetical protein B0H16DRAFT_1450760 [Mycena metata]|uniref:Uncharacterized protein n=1 Tax=Mycena metata TaxID=1033252 RepID=A0AAD7NSM8_9AGAR|nr:hypothetical protein B0H16DRAFT_1450760 [Mycena metata]
MPSRCCGGSELGVKGQSRPWHSRAVVWGGVSERKPEHARTGSERRFTQHATRCSQRTAERTRLACGRALRRAAGVSRNKRRAYRPGGQLDAARLPHKPCTQRGLRATCSYWPLCCGITERIGKRATGVRALNAAQGAIENYSSGGLPTVSARLGDGSRPTTDVVRTGSVSMKILREEVIGATYTAVLEPRRMIQDKMAPNGYRKMSKSSVETYSDHDSTAHAPERHLYPKDSQGR